MKETKSRFPRYAKFLKLYPAEYYKKYGHEILLTTADMLDEAKSRRERLLIWSSIALDLSANILRQQLIYAGGVMANETPHYVKRNSIVAGALLIPFAVALTANALNKMIFGQALYHSWLWRTPVLSTWVLILPELALLLALSTYVFFIVRKNKNISPSWVYRAVNLRRVWPMMIPAILALGILFIIAFHDSVQCWTNNPMHIHQALQCTGKNQSLAVFKHTL